MVNSRVAVPRELKLLVWLMVASMILNMGTTYYLNGKVNTGVTEDEVTSIVANEVSKIPTVDLSGLVTEEDLKAVEDRLQLGIDEDKIYENQAKELVGLELESRDFKKAVRDALVSYNVSIDSYRDITKIEVKDMDAERVLDTAVNVTVDVKVYYYVDGDEDETFRARLKEFVVTVNDMDSDDDFADMEIDDSYLTLVEVERVYD